MKRTSLLEVTDVIDDLNRVDTDQIWSVQSDGTDTINVLKDGTTLAGTDFLPVSPTLKTMLEISQLDYDNLVIAGSTDPNTLYIIPV